MKIKLTFLLLVLPLFVFGQNQAKDEDQIKAVVLKTFSAMKAVDSVALKSCFTSTALLQISQMRQEGASVRDLPVSKFVQSVLSRKPGEMDERVLSWGPILIDHEIATAWVPYEFYLNGKFSHKGVDVFLLVKTGNEFKIQTLLCNMQK
jgi:hypothetical protein